MRKKQSDKNKWIKFSKQLHTEFTGCSICGNSKYDIHHILEWRYYKEYRFCKENLIPLCKSHHKLSKFAVHQNALYFVKWLQDNRPEQHRWCYERL